MAALTVTAQQAAAITGLAAEMETALSGGIEQTGPIPVLGPAVGFDKLPSVVKTSIKFIFQSCFGAILTTTAGISGTVPLAKLTGGGSNGSLTFVNGMLTAKTDPT